MRRFHPVVLALVLPFLGCGQEGSEDKTIARDTNTATSDIEVSDTGSAKASLSKEHLQSVTSTLASDELEGRLPGTQGSEKARAFLIEEMKNCNIQPAGSDEYAQKIGSSKGVNLLGRILGKDKALQNRHVLMSAHYDHLGPCGGQICNGAYDNAAAVAAVLEVACYLSQERPERSILVAFWDAEEPPAFLSDTMGSQYFVANPLVALDEIDVAVVLDLAGSEMWPGSKAYFAMGSEKSPEVREAVAKAASLFDNLTPFVAGIHLPEEQPMGHQPWSDYDAFRNAEVPFLFLSDAQNKFYHTPDDDMDIINIEKLTDETTYLLSIAVQLANAQKTPVFQKDGEQYLQDLETTVSILKASLESNEMVDALQLSAQCRKKLEDDHTELSAFLEQARADGTVSTKALHAMRSAVQRVMCLAGSQYSAAMCLML
jgi:Zn-dependent M28 family amino/carboxypeptidase